MLKTNHINLRGVGIDKMTTVDWIFANVSLGLDRKEKVNLIESAIMSLGMLVNPEYAHEVYENTKLERDLTEEDKELLKVLTRKKANQIEIDGKVKSDPIVQTLIRQKVQGDDSIQTLADIAKEGDKK